MPNVSSTDFQRISWCREIAVAAGLLALTLLGCTDRDWETVYRLERAAGLADSIPETLFLDFGTEEARRLLIDGWSFNETNDAGLTFVWSHGRSSSFGFYVFPDDGGAITPVVLHFRVLPFEAPDAPPQILRFELNGQPIGEVALPTGIGDSELRFDREKLITGWNVFDVHYAWVRSDLASQAEPRWRRNQRNLGVAWIEARLAHPVFPSNLVHESLDGEQARAGHPEIDLRGQRLGLPAHHLLDYELEIDQGQRLITDAHCRGCDEDWSVEVYVGALDDAGLRRVGRLGPSDESVELGVGRLDTYRLVLRNLSPAKVVLERPRIERPRNPASH